MNEEMKRALELDKMAGDLISNYYNSLGKVSLTVLSALVAALAFLVNSHHIGYLTHPILLRRSVYCLFILSGLTYALSLIANRLNAVYLGYSRDIQATISRRQPKQRMYLEEKSSKTFSRLSNAHKVIEVAALLGGVLMTYISIALLHNILNS